MLGCSVKSFKEDDSHPCQLLSQSIPSSTVRKLSAVTEGREFKREMLENKSAEIRSNIFFVAPTLSPILFQSRYLFRLMSYGVSVSTLIDVYVFAEIFLCRLRSRVLLVHLSMCSPTLPCILWSAPMKCWQVQQLLWSVYFYEIRWFIAQYFSVLPKSMLRSDCIMHLRCGGTEI